MVSLNRNQVVTITGISIVSIDTLNSTVTTHGFYYHFIGQQFGFDNYEIDEDFPIDFWYPINPNASVVKLPVSLYLEDSTLTQRYESPCDSTNLPYDTHLGFNSKEDIQFEVFPNPSKGTYSVRFNDVGQRTLTVYDLLGKVVFQKISRDQRVEVDLTNEAIGTFILIVEDNDKIKYRKLVKL